MTEPAVKANDPAKVEPAFEAARAACALRGIEITRLDNAPPNCLGVELTGPTRKWPVYVDCDEKQLRLPKAWTDPPKSPLAHVSYQGVVCIDDEQGLSLDPSRPAEVVAHTLMKAYDLLESSAQDEATGHAEFFNELEGYWLLLPGSARSRAHFEVDGRSRMLRGFVKFTSRKPKWYFTEREAEVPSEIKNLKLEGQRVAYVQLDAMDLPPVRPDKVSVALLDDVYRRLSPEQLELWTQLLGPSKNSRKQVALLVSLPRKAGGASLIGVTFGAYRGVIDRNAPVTPLTMRRHTPNYMRERGGASLDLLEKHVVVLGAGAVGCVVVDTLAASGVGKITVVDPDEYSEDNVFRHLLQPMYIDFSKPTGLKVSLELRYPGLEITPVCTTAQTWLKTANLGNCDGIVLAFGAPTLERSFSRALKGRRVDLPIVFTWLEALDLGGHSVLMWSKGDGCLECAYRDDDGRPCLAPRTSFLEANQSVTRNLTGCGGAFVPYGAIQARRTGLLAAEHILSAIARAAAGDDTRQPSYQFWVGEGKLAAQHGLRTTPWFRAARTTLPEEATRQVFGRACACCRTPGEAT